MKPTMSAFCQKHDKFGVISLTHKYGDEKLLIWPEVMRGAGENWVSYEMISYHG